MEFVITKYGYYLPFKTDENNNQGITREYIKLNGSFLSNIESPNDSTRSLIKDIKVNFENITSDFLVFVASDEELKRLKNFEGSSLINTTLNLKATSTNLVIRGLIYLSQSSFDEMKSLIGVVPNSNAYFRFETIIHGDTVVSSKPLEIDLYGNASGVEVSFPIQQIKNSA
jgi:hypothetical protein